MTGLSLDGPLGLMLGAVISALRMSGHSPDEIRQWTENALYSYERRDEMVSAVEPLAEMAARIQREMP